MKSAKEKKKFERILSRYATCFRQMALIAQSALPPPPDVSKKSQEMLLQLDHARREYQSTIDEIAKNTVKEVCGECKGGCCYVCVKDNSHFYAIDFWLRHYTTSPIPLQEEIDIIHPAKVLHLNFYHMVLTQIRDSIENIHYLSSVIEKIRKHRRTSRGNVKNTIWPPEITDESIPCKFLSDHGCTFEPVDRPIICTAWTCTKLKSAFDIQTLKVVIENIKGLMRVHQDVLRLLRKEGKLGYFTGRSRLAVLPFSYGNQGNKYIGRRF